MQRLKIRENYEIIGAFIEIRRHKASCVHYSLFFNGKCLGNFLSLSLAIQTAEHRLLSTMRDIVATGEQS